MNSECFVQKHFRNIQAKQDVIQAEIVDKFPSFLLAPENHSKGKAASQESSQAAVCLPMPSTSKRIRYGGKRAAAIDMDAGEEDECMPSLAGKL